MPPSADKVSSYSAGLHFAAPGISVETFLAELSVMAEKCVALGMNNTLDIVRVALA